MLENKDYKNTEVLVTLKEMGDHMVKRVIENELPIYRITFSSPRGKFSMKILRDYIKSSLNEQSVIFSFTTLEDNTVENKFTFIIERSLEFYGQTVGFIDLSGELFKKEYIFEVDPSTDIQSIKEIGNLF
jgi:hypothetical protein